jgi:hypothetical protein
VEAADSPEAAEAAEAAEAVKNSLREIMICGIMYT